MERYASNKAGAQADSPAVMDEVPVQSGDWSDGFGHIGGGVGLLFIAGSVLPNLPAGQTGTLYAFLIIAAFLVVAAIIAQFGIRTCNQRLDVVSP